MEYQIEMDVVSEQLVAAARQQTTFARISREIGDLLTAPWALIRTQSGLRTNGDNVAIYWNWEGEGAIEVGVQVVRRFEESDQVVCSATPAGRVARTAHFGPYHQLGKAHNAVIGWCRRHGHQTQPPCWEVYGDWNDDPAKLRTDVFYLLK